MNIDIYKKYKMIKGKQKFIILFIILIINIISIVKAEYKCYSCVYDENQVVAGINNACYGKSYRCNIFGNNCNFCWSDTKYSTQMESFCSGKSNKYGDVSLITWDSSKCN